jgi:hypothetical protein
LQSESECFKLTLLQEIAPGQEPTLDGDANTAGDVAAGAEEGHKDLINGMTSGQPAEGASQTPAFGAGFGFDANAAGGFPGVFGGDMNQMQMMMAMQNGMAPNAFGNFPMMGM